MEQQFIELCRNGDLIGAQELYQLHPNIDISFNNEHVFQTTCLNGHLHVAQWLLRVFKERGQDIDILAQNKTKIKTICFTSYRVMCRDY